MADKKQIVNEIKNLIAMSEIENAISVFRQNCTKELENEIIGFSTRYQALLKEIRKGVIKAEDANIERNKICSAVLEIVDQLEIETSPTNNYRLDEVLEDVLALAETQSRRNGDSVTSTKHFFAALVTLHPNSLDNLIVELNLRGAMPNPLSKEVTSLPRIYSKSRPLSACLTDTATEMSKVADLGSPIKVEEFFVDVAKFGKGSSVKKMREKGVDVDELNNLVDKYEIKVRDRLTA